MDKEYIKKLAENLNLIPGIYNYCDRWYQHFIYVKLIRAVQGKLEETPQSLDEFPKDFDGSAKVALIAP